MKIKFIIEKKPIMKERIIELHNADYTYTQIAERLGITRNAVAGVIWRLKNPGMYKKGVKSTQHNHRWPYSVKK